MMCFIFASPCLDMLYKKMSTADFKKVIIQKKKVTKSVFIVFSGAQFVSYNETFGSMSLVRSQYSISILNRRLLINKRHQRDRRSLEKKNYVHCSNMIISLFISQVFRLLRLQLYIFKEIKITIYSTLIGNTYIDLRRFAKYDLFLIKYFCLLYHE